MYFLSSSSSSATRLAGSAAALVGAASAAGLRSASAVAAGFAVLAGFADFADFAGFAAALGLLVGMILQAARQGITRPFVDIKKRRAPEG